MKRNDGFTLIELIIVIAILAIIAAVAIPNIIFAVNNARIAADLSNARVISDSIQIVISKDNGISRVDMTEVEFREDISLADADAELLVQEAAKYVQGAPVVEYGVYAGSNFLVSIGSTTGIVVKVGTAGSATQIYPTPEGDWAN